MNLPTVHSLHHADTGSWTHLVADAVTGDALVIDPVLDYDARSGRTGHQFASRIAGLLRQYGYKLQWILETHAHADHLTAAAWLKSNCGGRIGIGAGIVDVQANFAALFNLGDEFTTDGRQFDRLFNDGEVVSVGHIEFSVIATPGHTSDSVSYLVGDALFAGDVLFQPESGTGRCDFPGGSAAQLFTSIRRLYELPSATRVFVGHDYPAQGIAARPETSIAAQKSGNVHLRASTSQENFVAMRNARDATLAVPALLLPALQVNIRAGSFPPAEANGTVYLKTPVDRL